MTTTSKGLEKAPIPPRSSQSRLVGSVSRIRELGLFIVLILIVAIVSIQVPRFLSPSNIEQILLSIAILAIVAVGETLVVLTRNVDLSVGSMVGLTAFFVANLFKQQPGTNLVLAILLGCAVGLVLGAINGLIVTVGRVPAIIVTLGTLYVYRGLDFVIAGGSQVSASDVPDSFLNLATARIGLFGVGVPALIIFAAAIALIFAYLLHSTRSGRQLYAIGSNPEAARLVGIRSDLLVFGTFMLSGLLCGFAGVLWGARFATVDATAATGLELQVVAAVVVGGVNIFGGSGTIIGAMLGAIVLGTIDDALNLLKLSQFWLQAIDGAAILVAVTLDSFITRWLQRTLVVRRQR
ncbi:sugar ABC transporter permease [Reticulibacter mediterranei]|uniref:Autoinducer 2 import system permease protein LsrC n=1 Tax=Reticulibacter mediterranei TaxID=2778369 RepID=A0A8J3IVK8_9CHLR|nr:ABC transporter permease [Reticulibacter mediterranei]GHO97635.1 sugar ABC transporter permease [Reticulibacter mediterranei]